MRRGRMNDLHTVMPPGLKSTIRNGPRTRDFCPLCSWSGGSSSKYSRFRARSFNGIDMGASLSARRVALAAFLALLRLLPQGLRVVALDRRPQDAFDVVEQVQLADGGHDLRLAGDVVGDLHGRLPAPRLGRPSLLGHRL